jgi:hypothetical protein
LSPDFERVRAYLAEHAERRGVGATDHDLVELGSLWGPLPTDFAAYLKEFGWATVGPHELLGLGKGVEWHQNLIERARELWRGDSAYKLPTELLPFYDSGGGWIYCLSKKHPGHPVVCWAQEHDDLSEPQPYDLRYPTWSAWFLNRIAAPPGNAND